MILLRHQTDFRTSDVLVFVLQWKCKWCFNCFFLKKRMTKFFLHIFYCFRQNFLFGNSNFDKCYSMIQKIYFVTNYYKIYDILEYIVKKISQVFSKTFPNENFKKHFYIFMRFEVFDEHLEQFGSFIRSIYRIEYLFTFLPISTY